MKVVVGEAAREFAGQDFWPNGEPRAKLSCFLASFMLFMLIIPVDLTRDFNAVIVIGVMGAASLALTTISFVGLKWALGTIVDPSLVKSSK